MSCIHGERGYCAECQIGDREREIVKLQRLVDVQGEAAAYVLSHAWREGIGRTDKNLYCRHCKEAQEWDGEHEQPKPGTEKHKPGCLIARLKEGAK